ncbi:TRAP transporter substrate-binding protein DctP [Aminithiophilus ramosus]|uniref:TRAP transporter substrate-binding protein DctP n=2 Tax=Synergistales TaxID=649776 RepID=A0A9Q7A7M3_9BACT|nr:TRAP transporter substrate-binding protein DctP [Aminithiophilus ramosus]QTX32265.1 TRAP transporter substrate-binding protein DctP [Aminithiophilus ramosus]QVL36132.1 TRAP transporter substrate-binding protein DctP [Synergistota bacterium]
MKKAKRFLLLGAALLLAVTVGTAPVASAKTTIKVAGISPVEYRSTQSLYRIAEKVKERTDGRIEMKVFPMNQLGDYTQVFEEIRRGTIEMGLIFLPSQFDVTLELGSMPFLAENYTQIRQALSPGAFVCDTLDAALDKLGVKQLRIFGEGFIGLGSTKKPEKPLDPKADKGLLVRVAPVAVYKYMAEDMGFRTTTIPYADTYSAIQTGVCDGWIGGSSQINYQVFGDVIKHYVAYDSLFDQTTMMINKKLWEGLSEEDRTVLQEAVDAEADLSFQLCQQEDGDYLAKMRERGIEVTTFTDAEKAEMARYIRARTWPKLKERLGDDLVDRLMEAYQ